ncbi:FAD-dependent oxidoreductase [Heliobacterium undosum]|uniref:FAD-dependent oxidoreductase n=1 Tax=Heliomicrobium undosum TaxID=121734 RepID=A0A845L774_9FIRM|nr:NAD(P)/FAD-dependent oxidoreductase [Heliomicrobium undosum]MZP30654.1 FAD-dependent oxidoreductase [Heliomicrobium undosum]
MLLKNPRILILGAGYAGLMTAVRLQKALRKGEADITLVNKHNYHYQTTLLHEIAAGTGEEGRVCLPIQNVIDTRRIRFIKDTVLEIREKERQVILCHGEPLHYDYLVVALGFEPATFGIPGIAEHAMSIRSLNAAKRIRNRIEGQIAEYAASGAPGETLTFVVGGAGFTGIEFIGELADQVPRWCAKYGVPRQHIRLFCVEAGSGLLPGFTPSLSAYARQSLEARGVEFCFNTRIRSVDAKGVLLEGVAGERRIEPATVVWTGGVQGNRLACGTVFTATRGRIPVSPDLRINGHDRVFVIGDCSAFTDPGSERPFPPTAQIAVLQALTCARNLQILVRGGRGLESFAPKLKGAVASLGSRDGVGLVLGVPMRGRLASSFKAIVDSRYLFTLGGFRLLLRKSKPGAGDMGTETCSTAATPWGD